MSFWCLQSTPDQIALLRDSGEALTYLQLAQMAQTLAARLPAAPPRTLGFLLFDTSFAAVALYLGTLLSRRHVPLLLQPTIHPALLQQLIDRYQPEWIAAGPGGPCPVGYDDAQSAVDDCRIWLRAAPASLPVPHAELALLLSTSGSTGSPKLVRLSYEAIAANAEAIARYLHLTAADRAVTTLPLAYSFGLSILNSHLAAGASVVMTAETLLSRAFWQVLQSTAVTSLSGVPSQFGMLRRAGLERRGIRSLRMLTQAGGNLGATATCEFDALCRRMGAEFFVMYGQTEAAPRISYVPPERLQDKIGSIGIAIPGGALELDVATAELIYRGPNVMMGYAECRQDLTRGDELGGVLHTGDLARRDDDGFFYLTGRTRRFIKLSGARVNLDEVESALSTVFDIPLACVGADERLVVVLGDDAAPADAAIRALLRDRFDIFGGLCQIERRFALPYASNGKLDYQQLMHLVA